MNAKKGLYFQDQTWSASFSIFLLAHYKMGKLPESLIIKTFVVLRGSPEVPLQQQPSNDSRQQTQSYGDEESRNVKHSKPDCHCVVISVYKLQDEMCQPSQ